MEQKNIGILEVTNTRTSLKFSNKSTPANTKKLGSDSGIASAVKFLKNK